MNFVAAGLTAPDQVNRVHGVEQGYKPLPVRHQRVIYQGDDDTTPTMTIRLELTEEERLRLLAGEDVYLRFQGSVPPPMNAGVGDWTTYGW